MKKFFILALLAAFSLSTQAQIVRSTTSMVTKEKKPRNFMWTARLNYSVDTYTGDSDIKAVSGFDGAFGFTKYANNDGRRDGILWGLEAVCMSNSCKYDPAKYETFAYGVYGAPRLGYKMPLVDNINIAPYVGAYVGYMFEAVEESGSTDGYYGRLKAGDCVSYGFTIGAELFLSESFFIDMHVRKSLAKDGEIEKRPYGYGQRVKDDISGFKFSVGCGFQF